MSRMTGWEASRLNSVTWIFDNSNRKSNLNDETRSLGTMNMQLPPDFAQDDDDEDSDLSLRRKLYGQ